MPAYFLNQALDPDMKCILPYAASNGLVCATEANHGEQLVVLGQNSVGKTIYCMQW